MQWCDFYDAFWDWSDTTRRTEDARVTDIATAIATTVLRIMAIAMVTVVAEVSH